MQVLAQFRAARQARPPFVDTYFEQRFQANDRGAPVATGTREGFENEYRFVAKLFGRLDINTQWIGGATFFMTKNFHAERIIVHVHTISWVQRFRYFQGKHQLFLSARALNEIESVPEQRPVDLGTCPNDNSHEHANRQEQVTGRKRQSSRNQIRTLPADGRRHWSRGLATPGIALEDGQDGPGTAVGKAVRGADSRKVIVHVETSQSWLSTAVEAPQCCETSNVHLISQRSSRMTDSQTFRFARIVLGICIALPHCLRGCNSPWPSTCISNICQRYLRARDHVPTLLLPGSGTRPLRCQCQAVCAFNSYMSTTSAPCARHPAPPPGPGRPHSSAGRTGS